MRLRIFQQLRVQSVSPDGGGRREDVAFHGFYDISAVEAPLEGQQRKVDCVNSKDIAVNSFIVPRRARTVIAIIVSLLYNEEEGEYGSEYIFTVVKDGADYYFYLDPFTGEESEAASMQGSSGTISTNTQ